MFRFRYMLVPYLYSILNFWIRFSKNQILVGNVGWAGRRRGEGNVRDETPVLAVVTVDLGFYRGRSSSAMKTITCCLWRFPL